MTVERFLPVPYAFLLRRCNEAREFNVGFLTKSFGSFGAPWSEDMASGMPGRLSTGDSSVNAGRNLTYEGWDRLDKGGMGAEIATDRSRYRYSAGMYLGDPFEFYAQPRSRSFTRTDGPIPAWEPAGCVLPTDAVSTIASVTSDTVFVLADGDGFEEGAGIQITISNFIHHRRIEAIVGDTVTIDLAIGGLAALVAGDPAHGVNQQAQEIRQILHWKIPAAVPDALSSPGAQIAVTTEGETLTTGITAADLYFFCYTKLSPWGESLRSTEMLHTVGATAKAINIQFGSNSGSEVADGVTYAANTRDWPGITGYKIYGYKGESGDVIGDFDEDKLKVVATIGVRSNQQEATPKPRYTYSGGTLSEGAPPEYVATLGDEAETRILVLACDGFFTYFYQVQLTGVEAGTIIPLLPVRDVDNFLNGRVVGTMEADTATVWNGQVIVPTTLPEGTQGLTRMWLDTTQALHAAGYSQDLRCREMTGILGHVVYAESQRRLWRVYRNLAWWSADPLGGDPEWTGPIAVGGVDYDVKHIISYGGAKNSSDSAVYFTKADGLYRILDTDVGPANRAEWLTDFGVPQASYGTPLLEHRGELYIGAGESMFRYTIASFDIVGPNRDGGLPISLRGWVGGAASTNRHLYVGMGHDPEALSGAQYAQIVETEQGEAWHQLHWAGSPTTTFSETSGGGGETGWGPLLCTVPKGMTAGSGQTILLFTTGLRDNLAWVPIRSAGERLREATGYLPRADALLVLPKYYSDTRYVEKIWHTLQVAQSLDTAPDQECGIKIDVRKEQPALTGWDWQTISYNEVVRADPPDEEDNWIRAYPNLPDYAPEGRLYAANFYQQELSGMLRSRVIRSEGLSIRVWLEQNGSADSVPLVLNEIVLTSAEVGLALGRWVFSCELAMNQILSNGEVERTTSAEFWTAREQLDQFARNSDPLILTDAGGQEHLVRLDLGRVLPVNWKSGYQEDDTAYIEPLGIKFDITLTELRNLDDTSRSYTA